MPKQAGAQLREVQAAHPGAPLIAISGQFRAGLSTAGATAQTLGVQRVIAKAVDLYGPSRGGARYYWSTELSDAERHRMSAIDDLASPRDRLDPIQASATRGDARCSGHAGVRGVIRVRRLARVSQYARAPPSAKSATWRTALAEQTAWTWQGVDLLLRGYGALVSKRWPKIAPERLDEVLANRTAGVRQVRLLRSSTRRASNAIARADLRRPISTSPIARTSSRSGIAP